MKTYLDCGSGIAGDMLLGALIELGLPLRELNRMFQKAIPVSGWRLDVRGAERQGWPAHTFVVKGDRYFGSGPKMQQAVRHAKLPKPVQQTAIQIFDRLIEAEKKAHGGHSKGEFDKDGLGLLDTLFDVLGSAWGFWRLGLQDVTASPVNTGRIAPATAQILKERKIPVYSTQSQYELATPTGIAILSVMASHFGPMPALELQKAGYGAGSKDIPGKPNVVAIYQLSSGPGLHPAGTTIEKVLLLETVIDDMDPRLYPHVTEQVMAAGALDAWWISAGMKKGRPGTAYSVLCRPEDENKMTRILFRETTTLGIRRHPQDRWVLPRIKKGFVKIADLPSGGSKSRGEFELVKKRAQTLSIPLVKLLK